MIAVKYSNSLQTKVQVCKRSKVIQTKNFSEKIWSSSRRKIRLESWQRPVLRVWEILCYSITVLGVWGNAVLQYYSVKNLQYYSVRSVGNTEMENSGDAPPLTLRNVGNWSFQSFWADLFNLAHFFAHLSASVLQCPQELKLSSFDCWIFWLDSFVFFFSSNDSQRDTSVVLLNKYGIQFNSQV